MHPSRMKQIAEQFLTKQLAGGSSPSVTSDPATQPLSLSARTTAILSSMPNGPAKTRLTELQSRIVAQQTRALNYVNISLARKSVMQRGTY